MNEQPFPCNFLDNSFILLNLNYPFLLARFMLID
jgi:hypothetical protein